MFRCSQLAERNTWPTTTWTTTTESNEEEFSAIAQLHNEICPSQHTTCRNIQNITYATDNQNFESKGRCCGFCECHVDCIPHTSCCLDIFESFEAGYWFTKEKSRYECTIPRLLPTDKTKYPAALELESIWMVSDCHPEREEELEEEVINSCKYPAMYSDLEAILPVTDFYFNYKNKFCALCGSLSKPEEFEYWSVEIYCDKTITFTYETLLATIKREECNLFYRPPKFAPTQQCNVQSYRISTCNETGLWRTYNKTIEHACRAFLDPFNSTYKNYFCYLCNVLEPIPHDSWHCMNTHRSEEYPHPVFSFVATLDVLKQINDGPLMKCKFTQYQDKEKLKCRDVFCSTKRYTFIANQKCLPNDVIDSSMCYLAFMKLTPKPQYNLKNEDILGSNALHRTIKSNLHNYNSIHDIQVYKNAVSDSTDAIINYIVVEFKINIADNMFPSLYEIISRFHRSNIELYTDITKAPARIPVEFALYRKSENNLYVHHFEDNSVDILRPFYVYPSDASDNEFTAEPCQSATTIFLHKLHLCQYVELEVGEIPFTVVNRFLLVKGKSKDIILSDWEYKLISETLLICVEDLERIYAILTVDELTDNVNNTTVVNNKTGRHVSILSLFSACLFITSTCIWMWFDRN